MREDPRKPLEFIYKTSCIYSYMFKLQSSSKYSPFNAIHLLRHFFHCSKQVLNLLILMPCRASAVFCFTFSTSAKCFPWRPHQNVFLWGLFSSRETKSLRVRSGQYRGWSNKGHAVLGQKLLNTQHSKGRYACKSPIMKWAKVLKV